MGFILDVDLETSQGPSHEVYVRVESLSFNKVTSIVQFQLTYWQEQAYATRFNRTYFTEDKKNAEGLVQERVLYFQTPDSDGEEILLPHHMKVPAVRVKEVEVPKYEMKTVIKNVPFVSFDENGDEITLTREISVEERVRTGVEVEEVEVIDSTILNDIFGFCYEKAFEHLSQWFPKDKILIVK